MRFVVLLAILAVFALVIYNVASKGGSKSSSVTLTINSIEVSSVPWTDGEVGTVVWNSGVNELAVTESLTEDEALEVLERAPWYNLSSNVAGEIVIVIDHSNFPGEWNDKIHGLYTTTVDDETVRGKMSLRIERSVMVPPMSVNGSVLTYASVSGMAMIGGEMVDKYEILESSSPFLMVITPYKQGVFLLADSESLKMGGGDFRFISDQ